MRLHSAGVKGQRHFSSPVGNKLDLLSPRFSSALPPGAGERVSGSACPALTVRTVGAFWLNKYCRSAAAAEWSKASCFDLLFQLYISFLIYFLLLKSRNTRTCYSNTDLPQASADHLKMHKWLHSQQLRSRSPARLLLLCLCFGAEEPGCAAGIPPRITSFQKKNCPFPQHEQWFMQNAAAPIPNRSLWIYLSVTRQKQRVQQDIYMYIYVLEVLSRLNNRCASFWCVNLPASNIPHP